MSKKIINTGCTAKEKSEEMFRKNFIPISFLLIVAVTFIAYSNSFENSFQYDDVHHIKQNRQIKDLNNFYDPGYWFDFINRAPAQLTFAVNYYYGGYGVKGYHAVNLLIHLISSLLVFVLLGLLLDSKSIKQDYIIQNKRYIRLFSTLIFAVHPIQTESVTYIVQRMESLSGAFYIAALIFYYMFRAESSNRKRIIEFSVFLVFGLLSVMTKQTAYTMPLAILLLEIYFIRNYKGESNKKLIIYISSVLALAVIIGLITDILPREYMSETTRWQYLLSQFTVIPKYIFLLFFPIGQNIDHHVFIPHNFFELWILMGFALILALFYVIYVLYKNGYLLLSFSIAWFFAMISLRSSILPISDLMSEHRLYTSVISYGLVISILLMYLKNKMKLNDYTFAVILSITVLVYAISTFERNKVWKDELFLWNDSVSKSPEKFRPNYNIAEAYKKAGDSQTALEFYLKAYKLSTQSYGVCNNIGNIYSERKDYDKAESYYTEALKLNPGYPKSLNNLANINFRKGKFKEAEELYSKAIELDNNFIDPYLNLGHLYFISEHYGLAVINYKRVLEINPNNEQARNNLKIIESKLSGKEK